MYLALGALGGLGFPEVFVVLFVWALPVLVVWKFYQLLSRIANDLAGIKQALRDRNP
jgi:hypothetical protein